MFDGMQLHRLLPLKFTLAAISDRLVNGSQRIKPDIKTKSTGARLLGEVFGPFSHASKWLCQPIFQVVPA